MVTKLLLLGMRRMRMRDVLLSCDDDITLNLMFLLLYCDKSYIV